MQRQINFAAQLPLLLLLGMILSGCATRSAVSPAVQIPAPPAALMTDDSADSQAYSQKVRDWLKKAADELNSLQPRRPGCSETQPASGKCL